jgi:2-polyprenyl-3-methyl-5-hydroxy-6-metoxy-1,4-benzoquinol methylase
MIAENLRQSKFAPRQCPVCHVATVRTLFQQRFEQLSDVSLLDRYNVVVCASCGAAFADDIPDQPALDEYYRELSKYDYADITGIKAPPAVRRFQDTADVLEKYIPSSESRVLEIGCASGELLKALRDRGFRNVLGMDPSAGCARTAKHLYGVSVKPGTIWDMSGLRETFDFIILVGVLEHIREIAPAIQALHPVLAPRGRVYVEVPNAARFTPNLDAPFQEFSAEHINFFSPQSLTNAMALNSFQPVAIECADRLLHDITVPVAFGIYEKSNPGTLKHDFDSEPALVSYIKGCELEDRAVRENIADRLRAYEKVIVWGVGTHTLRLLANGGLDPKKIRAFVDSNPKYQNKVVRGVSVISPESLRSYKEPILISSRGSQREILAQIRSELNIENHLITLYAP